ncbi:U3 small nucleolar RNA-associated protein 18 homolog wicked [Rhodnius prolixus]|uniref:U3 small nucleolar RNA-associated protein 18 homolog n=1 Tax=Rhodnius prolixus TaxID=13249 RepID=R4FLG7_RHOPR
MDPAIEEGGTRKRKYVAEKGKAKKKKHLSTMVNAEKERLEKLVFGDPSYMLRNMGFGDPDSGVEDDGAQDSDTYSDTLASPPRVPAWVDEDDMLSVTGDSVRSGQDINNSAEYGKFLRRKFQSVYGEPSWAKLNKADEEHRDEEDQELLRTCGNMLNKSSYLAKSFLRIKRLASLNCETRNEGPIIKAVRFHPTSTVALVAGVSGCASIIQVDGKTNPKLASVRFDRFPIRCARFSADGSEFIVGSHRHSHFYVYDMIQGSTLTIYTHHNVGQTNMKKFEVSPDSKLIAIAGRFGQIHLLSAKSKEWIGNLAMNGNVEAITFDSDGTSLYSHGELGEVHIWDVNRRCLTGRFLDDGCLVGTSIAISPCGSYLAAGSSSGVVNIYDKRALLARAERSPTPLKAIMNLVTPVKQVTFNHSSQLLGIASDEKDNAVKMVHLPSMTVYQNFPALNEPIGRVQNFAFSPSSGYFSCGNNKNTAYLYRLKHFGDY